MAVMALSGLAMVAAGCGSDTTTSSTGTAAPKDFKIKSINPSTVYIEGQDTVTLTTENGCGKDKISVKVGDIPVTGVQGDATNNIYTFTAPAKDVTGETPVPVPVHVECSAPPDTSFVYGKKADDAVLNYDPKAEPAPTIKTPSPLGGDAHANGISVLAQMVVVFTRAVDPATVTKDTFGITGITGTISHEADNKTFRFKPDQQLVYGTQYTCFVTTGVQSAKSHKALKPTIAPGNGTPAADRDSWTFTTRCEGCGNPWLGDISAAAGISSGGSYKLFSVTGQPTPVGEATNEQYKLQSGFIYATAPGAQQ